MSAPNTPIIVGGKAVANYALAIQTRLAAGQLVVTLRARGQHIARAVDAANMAINIGLPVTRGEIRWGQESGPASKNVSFIEIQLASTAG